MNCKKCLENSYLENISPTGVKQILLCSLLLDLHVKIIACHFCYIFRKIKYSLEKFDSYFVSFLLQ